MVRQKNAPAGLKFTVPLTISLLVHGALLCLLIFGLPGDVERPAGYGESEIISVSIVTGAADRASEPLETDVAQSRRTGWGIQSPGGTSEKAPPKAETWSGESGSLARSATREQLEGGEGGVSFILQQIRNKIERNKYYPLIAKRSRIEGSPLIEFKIKPDGSLEYVLLQKSSGHKILDESAVTTVRQAAPYPFYPEPITLNIHYTLAR